MGMSLIEDWRDVQGYEDAYQVSSLGRARTKTRLVSCHKKHLRTIKGKMLKPIAKQTGYIQLGLSKNGKIECGLMHRLVAQAFIPNPENKPQVNHIDGNPANNHVSNLEWCTVSENGLHAYRTLGVIAWHKGNLGADTPTAKPVIQMAMDGTVIKRWECASDAVREFGFDSGCISRVAHGLASRHKGYRWEYAEH